MSARLRVTSATKLSRRRAPPRSTPSHLPMGKNIVQDLLNNPDIQDPSDFPQRMLQELDSALRCKICQELLEAPVVLPCGHCFCSLCARSQISEKEVCPACWKPATEDQLRVNPAMEEVVTAWKAARALALRLATDDHIRQTRPQSPEPTLHRPAKKRRVTPDSDIEVLETIAGPSTPRKASKRGSSHPSPSKPKPKSKPEARYSESPDDGRIHCPACAKRVPMDQINEHLDSGCRTPPTNTKQKDAWSKLFAGETRKKGKDKSEDEEPLPKVSYQVLKEKQIRELLATFDLLSTGDRALLVARHQRWVTIYNANLDRTPSQRRRLAELRGDMRKWEEDRKTIAKRGTAREVSRAVDSDEHQRKNKAEFAALVVRARPKTTAPQADSSPPPVETEAQSRSLTAETQSSTVDLFLQVDGKSLGTGKVEDAIVVE